MKNNIGTTDRMLRIALSIILIAFSISASSSFIIKTILIILSIFLIFTSIIGFCPIYKVFNFNSKRIDPLERRK
ncbi:MAG: YgaP family membrane protein [Candidatus Hydrothermia bacterium]